MNGLLGWLVAPGFMPHGHCYFWRADILWMHVASDAAIALAYYSIPITLLYFVRRRPDIPFRGVFVMFALFIVACGTNHLMDIWTTWNPQYAIEGLFKTFTAAISVATAVALVPLVPQALTLRSPLELEAANRALRDASARHADTTVQLDELRERFAVLADHGAPTLWAADPTGAVHYESPAFQRTHGVALKAGAGPGAWLTRVHPDDRERVAEAFARDLPLSGLDLDYRLTLPDGRVRWMHERAFYLPAHAGRPARVVGLSEDLTDAREAAAALAWQATHDPLTGLPVRSVVEARLDTLLGPRARPGAAALVFVDADRLGLVNLQDGYAQGDALVRHLGAVLRATFADAPMCRVCGGSFAVLLEDCSGAQAAALAQGALDRLASQPLRGPGGTAAVQATAVVVDVERSPGLHGATALRRAHGACLRAKTHARGRVSLDAQPQHAPSAPGGALAELHQALTGGGLALAWQPIASAAPTAVPARFEVFARLPTRDGRVLAAEAFLPEARAAHMDGAVDRAVVTQVAQLLGTQERYRRIGQCHLNLGAAALGDPQFVEFFTDTLARAGVPPTAVCVELREADVLAAPAQAARLTRALHEAGTAVALEHCTLGAGAVTLRGLALDYLKLDLAGAADLLADPLRRTVVSQAVDLAGLLGAQVVVTGVETPAARHAVFTLGATACQGYAVGPIRPLAPVGEPPAPWE